MAANMNVTLNGEARTLQAGLNIRGMLQALGLDPAKIAVERNLKIVPRSAYDAVLVTEGDRFEIVHFIGGGNLSVDLPRQDKPLVIAGRSFGSRLIVGTGKYKSYEDNARALEASGAEMVTVAVRRVNLTDPSQPRLGWSISSIPRNTPICPTPRAASPARRRCARSGWRGRRAAGPW